MWMLVCGIYIYGTMYGGPPYIVKPPCDCMSGWACRPPRALTLSLHIPTISWVRDTHSDSCPVSQWRKECVCVCALHPSVHNQCKGSGNSSRHIDTSSIQLHYLSLCAPDFLLSPVYFSKHGCRGPEESGSVARLQRGQEWKYGGGKGTEGVGVRIPLSDPAHAF